MYEYITMILLKLFQEMQGGMREMMAGDKYN
jgi:hypothetical protein